MSTQTQILQIRLRPKDLLEEHPTIRSYLDSGWKLVEAYAAHGICKDIYLTVCLNRCDEPGTSGVFLQEAVSRRQRGSVVHRGTA